MCGEPAISLHSHHLSLVQWTTCYGGPGFKTPGGYLCETGILLLTLSGYIGDPDVMRSLASLPFNGCFTKLRADNV